MPSIQQFFVNEVQLSVVYTGKLIESAH